MGPYPKRIPKELATELLDTQVFFGGLVNRGFLLEISWIHETWPFLFFSAVFLLLLYTVAKRFFLQEMDLT